MALPQVSEFPPSSAGLSYHQIEDSAATMSLACINSMPAEVISRTFPFLPQAHTCVVVRTLKVKLSGGFDPRSRGNRHLAHKERPCSGILAKVQKTIFQSRSSGLSGCLQEFICPISLEVMTSPVMILSTKKIYDNGSLQTWFQQGTARVIEGTKNRS